MLRLYDTGDEIDIQPDSVAILRFVHHQVKKNYLSKVKSGFNWEKNLKICLPQSFNTNI